MSIFDEIKRDKQKFSDELHDEMKSLADLPRESDEPAGFKYQQDGVVFGDVPPKANASEYLKAAVGWVYSCVSAISDAIARNGIGLYKVGKDGEIESVTNHKALDLLDRVNDFTTKYDHIWLSQSYLELTGESPWFVDRGPSGMGEPTSILLLRPDRLSIVQSTDKNSSNPIGGFKYKVDEKNVISIKSSELVFLKFPDPANPFRGKGTLSAAALTVDLDNYAEDWNKRFFFNAARPDMVLSTDQKMNEKQKKDLRSDINRLYKGKNNAHKTMVLESGLKATPFSLSQKDMEYLEQQKFSLTKILAIFRVPKSIVGISDDVNLANAKIGEYVFAKWTIRPKLERIVSQLNEFYLPMFNNSENLFFAFDDPVPADLDSNLKQYDSALAHGWMTINEIREHENLTDIGEAGDQILVPNNFVPVENAGQSLGITDSVPRSLKVNRSEVKRFGIAETKGIISRSAGGYLRAKTLLEKAKQKQLSKTEAQKEVAALNNRIDNIAFDMVKSLVKKDKTISSNRKADKEDKVNKFVDIYVKSVSKYEKVFKMATQLIFENQMEKILRKAPEKAIAKIDDYLLDEEDETQIMVRIYDPLVRQIISEQGTRAARLVGSGASFEMATQTVRAYLADRAFKFSFEMNEETNRLLSVALQEGVKEGEGIPQLRSRVQSVFADMEKYRAERIARSEVVRASNFAATEAYDQSGVVEELQWLVTPDDRLCPYCEPLDGKTIGVGSSFFEKGDKVQGKDGAVLDLNYENIDFPPLHANCRCTVVPVIK